MPNGGWWTLSGGTLSIFIVGDMPDYNWNNAPWRLNRADITSVTISNSVTSIGDFAFYDCANLTSVTIPGSVLSIGTSAFLACVSLASVTIPDSVTSIENSAFYQCKAMTSVIIGDSVTTIDRDAFALCENLASVTIPSSVEVIGYGAFAVCRAMASVTINGIWMYIDEDAFDACYSLTDVYYTGTEEQWGEINFNHNGNDPLLNATIHYNYSPAPPPVPIPPGAFSVAVRYTDAGGNEFTTSFSLNMVAEYYDITPPTKAAYFAGDTLDDTGLSVLYYASDGTSADITSSCTLSPAAGTAVTQSTTVSVQYDGAEIGSFAITLITLESVAITAYPTAIGCAVGDTLDYTGLAVTAYYSDGTTEDVTDACVLSPAEGTTAAQAGTLTVSVSYQNATVGTFDVAVYEDAGDWWTYGGGVLRVFCNGAMPNYSYNQLANDAPWSSHADSITTVIISNGVTSVGRGAFGACPNLASVTIPGSVTSIGDAAFINCDSLTSFTIPNGVTSIGDGAFALCENLASVTIPNSVTTIKGAAFYGCALTSVTIPNRLAVINDSTFVSCSNLASVIIPLSVAKIDYTAFDRYNSALTDVYYAGTEAQWNEIKAFHYEDGREEIYPIDTCWGINAATKHYNSAGPM